MKIGIIGTGNVAWHMAAIIEETDNTLTSFYSRNSKEGEEFAKYFGCQFSTDISKSIENDLILIAVPDKVISDISNEIKGFKGLVCHTAGSVGIDILSDFNRYGVLYPLQTLTKFNALDPSEIPFFIESNNKEDGTLLADIIQKAGANSRFVDSEQRLILHVAAVFASNFTNHLYAVAQKLLDDNGIQLEAIMPLISQTSKKIKSLEPSKAQTGPAIRQDTDTMEKHLKVLESFPNFQELYQKLSNSIIKKAEG